MTQLNGSAKIIPIRPREVTAPTPDWKSYLTTTLACLLIVAIGFAFAVFIAGILASLIITGAVILVFAGVTGAVGWVIGRLP